MEKAPDAFRTISEVADDLDVPKHVLRFWEGKFAQLRPMKRGGGRRYYRPEDIELLRAIRHLLYSDGYTIRGVQKILKAQGARYVIENWRDLAPGRSGGRDGDDALEMGSEADDRLPLRRVDAPPVLDADHMAALVEELESCKRILAAAKSE